MLLDDLPEPPFVGPVRGPFVHDARHAQRERTIDDVGVSCDPAHIGSAPEGVVGLEVEDPLAGKRGPQQIAAGGVQDALGLAGGARCVEDEQGMLTVHGLGGAVDRHICFQLMPPMVPAVRPIDLQSGPPIDHHVLDGGALGHGTIGVDFEGKGLAPPVAAVGRDQHLGPAIQDPAGQGLGTEPAEDHHVRCADPRAGQDGDHQLRDHRQVDRDDVPLLDPQALEDVGKFRDVAQQVLISQDPALARLTFPDQGGPVLV